MPRGMEREARGLGLAVVSSSIATLTRRCIDGDALLNPWRAAATFPLRHRASLNLHTGAHILDDGRAYPTTISQGI